MAVVPARVNNELVRANLNRIGRNECAQRDLLARPGGLALSSGKRILITGGAGNVGSNLSLGLVSGGNRVFALDNLSKGHREACELTGAELIRADLEDYNTTERVLAEVKPDVVLHAASYIEVGESTKDPQKYISGNIGGGINLFRAMQETGTSRLLFSNTAAVYDGTLNKALTEEDPIRPGSVYGATKAFLGSMLRAGIHFPDIQTISLHYFNVFGAQEGGFLREDHGIMSESHLVPIAMQVAIYNLIARFGLKVPGFDADAVAAQYYDPSKGGRSVIKVFGSDFDTPDGTCVRDYISLDMMVFYHMQALRRLFNCPDAANYEVYNLGTKTGRSVLEVINSVEHTVRKETGLPLGEITDAERVIPIVRDDRREGDVGFLVADPGKVCSTFGRPTYSAFDEDLARTFWSMLYRPLGYADHPAVDQEHRVMSFY